MRGLDLLYRWKPYGGNPIHRVEAHPQILTPTTEENIEQNNRKTLSSFTMIPCTNNEGEEEDTKEHQKKAETSVTHEAQIDPTVENEPKDTYIKEEGKRAANM